ncbi:class I SAM-dependent methyltransferase [Janibacter sp. LM]|uniref:class I SAM-dependent methyltransferase n=1 Tax=Janibacter sp. LM TaxID=3144845 RepID=UPI0031F6CC24
MVDDHADDPAVETQAAFQEEVLARLAALEERMVTLINAQEAAPSDVAEYLALRSATAPEGLPPFPSIGHWAATAPTLAALVHHARRMPAGSAVLECGSGVSTLWLALALRRAGRGHCFALEHDAEHVRRTRTLLETYEVSGWATVVEAPLTTLTIGGVERLWYDTAELPDDLSVGLLFVDGPPASTGSHARYPALSALQDRLGENSTIVLDDTVREEERTILTRWLDESGGCLEVDEWLPKSVVCRWVRRRASHDDQEH